MLDERRNPGVRLVVVFFMGKFPQLRQERDGIPRGKQGQQVRGQKLSHCSPKDKQDTGVNSKTVGSLVQELAYDSCLKFEQKYRGRQGQR